MYEPEFPEEKKEPNKMKSFLYLLLFILFLISGFAFMISPTFAVGNITVSGNIYMNEQEILQVAHVPEKINIFRLNASEMQMVLCKDLRIEQAKVTRSFPSTIHIEVVERRPTAYAACDYGFLELDKTGMVLAAFKTLKNIKVPLITGITLQGLYVGEKVDEPVFLAVLYYLLSLDEVTLNQLSEVSMENKEHIVVYTTKSLQIRLGNMDRMKEKAVMTQDFLKDEQVNRLTIEYVDFNFASPVIKLKK